MICRHCKKEIPDKATKCPECQSDLRNWFVRHKIITGILVLVFLGFILSAIRSDSSSSLENSNSATEQAQDSDAKEYQDVISLNTTSNRNSDTFTLEGGKQKLTYTMETKQFAMCNIYLLDEGTDLQSDGGFPVVTMAQESGETILRKRSGNYYISIQANNTNCSVSLEEER